MELSEIRNEIDKLDKQIQNLFEERMLLCQDVARYKKAHNMPVFQGRKQCQRRTGSGIPYHVRQHDEH